MNPTIEGTIIKVRIIDFSVRIPLQVKHGKKIVFTLILEFIIKGDPLKFIVIEVIFIRPIIQGSDGVILSTANFIIPFFNLVRFPKLIYKFGLSYVFSVLHFILESVKNNRNIFRSFLELFRVLNHS